MNRSGVLLFVASGLLLASCAVGPGDKPDAVPPKLSAAKDGNTTWDRPGAFGPVPAAQKALGDRTCGDKAKPIGFHPAVQGTDGKAFAVGGFLCQLKD